MHSFHSPPHILLRLARSSFRCGCNVAGILRDSLSLSLLRPSRTNLSPSADPLWLLCFLLTRIAGLQQNGRLRGAASTLLSVRGALHARCGAQCISRLCAKMSSRGIAMATTIAMTRRCVVFDVPSAPPHDYPRASHSTRQHSHTNTGVTCSQRTVLVHRVGTLGWYTVLIDISLMLCTESTCSKQTATHCT